ncbi:hypothetical protein GCM10022234_30830 [Aeromicrobium panaciterrae]|uniref:LPXTG cell wall anchor domain-containing protein n=1 Tax=Aeromicrobium panaciterrae TaxID=363861 RepID=UPI0031D4BF77
MITRFLRAALTIGIVLVAAVPAAAADEIGLSRNGVTFSSSLGGPLFDNPIIWVPGDLESETFYVRNQGDTAAKLTVDILGDQAGDLIDSGDLHVTALSGAQSTTASDGAEHRLLTVGGVEADEIVPVTITVELDESSTNETQLRASELNFRINLQQSSAVLGEDDEALPDTGTQTPAWLLVLATACLAAGLALISRRRTHTERSSHV